MDKFFFFQKLSILLSKINGIKKWQLVLCLFIITELMTFTLNSIQSIIWWGYLNTDLILIGTIDAAVIVAILGPILIYLVSQMTRFEEYRKDSIAQSQAEQKYRHYIENAPDIITVLDKNGFIKYESPSIEKILGYQPNELIGKNVFDYLHSDEREYVFNVFKEKINEYNSSAAMEIRFLKRNGSWINLSVSGRNLLHDELVEGIVLNSKDITDLKQTQTKLLRLLDEKKTLIREIHHRVKNNFQSVSSMLVLQASTIKDEKLQEILNVSRNRIHSLAILHENLQEAEDVSSVNLLNYFQRLIDSIGKSYKTENQNIIFDVNIDSRLELQTNQSIQLGLIFNELISNVYKHAFHKKQSGNVQINFDRRGETNYFMVKDNGVGLKQNFDITTSNSLGLKIVSMISKQLEGQFSFKSNKGTEFILKFPHYY